VRDDKTRKGGLKEQNDAFSTHVNVQKGTTSRVMALLLALLAVMVSVNIIIIGNDWTRMQAQLTAVCDFVGGVGAAVHANAILTYRSTARDPLDEMIPLMDAVGERSLIMIGLCDNMTDRFPLASDTYGWFIERSHTLTALSVTTPLRVAFFQLLPRVVKTLDAVYARPGADVLDTTLGSPGTRPPFT